jgi:hypothetical protein
VIERVETIRGRFLKWGIRFTAEAQRTQRKRGGTPIDWVANSVSMSDCSQRRSALAPFESHVWAAALMRATSGLEKSLAGVENAGLQTIRSWPVATSRFNSAAFSWPASSAMQSLTFQVARIEPTSTLCTPSKACRCTRWLWAIVSLIGCSSCVVALVIDLENFGSVDVPGTRPGRKKDERAVGPLLKPSGNMCPWPTRSLSLFAT